VEAQLSGNMRENMPEALELAWRIASVLAPLQSTRVNRVCWTRGDETDFVCCSLQETMCKACFTGRFERELSNLRFLPEDTVACFFSAACKGQIAELEILNYLPAERQSCFTKRRKIRQFRLL
jgi:hypothetical protein